MDTEQITADLNRRFAEPLPEFYKRRVIVWHDEEREFADKIAEITLDNAKIASLTGTNNFAVKKLLAVDDTESNYLLYSPCSYEALEDNWLLDIELYSEEFRADLISMWMDEMGLPKVSGLRSAIKPYRKFMNAKERRRRIMAQKTTPTTDAGLQLAIMAALAGEKTAKPAAIIKAVLKGGLNSADNALWREFINYGIDGAFWRMVAHGTGYQAGAKQSHHAPASALGHPWPSEDEKDLGRLAAHIILTAATRTLRSELLKGLEEYISAPHQSNCYDLISEWLCAEDNDNLHEIAEYVESGMNLHERFMRLTVEDLVNTAMFPCVNEIILVNLIRDIEKNIIDPAAVKQVVEKRRTCAWYEDVKNFYDGLYQVANMQEFHKAHAEGFHTTEPNKIWEEYAEDYYRFDSYYRLFHKSYEASLKVYHADLSDMFPNVKDTVEGLYVNWFLAELGESWSNAAADQMREHGKIHDVPLQTDFYRYKVAPAESRTYVIISDAMRYEVAAELAEVLRRETQSKVEISSMQGIFPTVTKFGMAALLPHKKLSVKFKSDKLWVLADGESTEAPMRDKILKSANPKSVALKYKDLIGMKRAERSALVRGMDVVYIYHDTIDEAGHSEGSIFGACAEAIKETPNKSPNMIK